MEGGKPSDVSDVLLRIRSLPPTLDEYGASIPDRYRWEFAVGRCLWSYDPVSVVGVVPVVKAACIVWTVFFLRSSIPPSVGEHFLDKQIYLAMVDPSAIEELAPRVKYCCRRNIVKKCEDWSHMLADDVEFDLLYPEKQDAEIVVERGDDLGLHSDTFDAKFVGQYPVVMYVMGYYGFFRPNLGHNLTQMPTTIALHEKGELGIECAPNGKHTDYGDVHLGVVTVWSKTSPSAPTIIPGTYSI